MIPPFKPGDVDAGDGRFPGLPPDIAAALHDRAAAARAARRARVICAITAISAYAAGIGTGLLWSV